MKNLVCAVVLLFTSFTTLAGNYTNEDSRVEAAHFMAAGTSAILFASNILNDNGGTSDGKWEVGTLFEGVSEHFTETYAPPLGYNEVHTVGGIEISQYKEGFGFGVSVASFYDSYKGTSRWEVATAEYTKFLFEGNKYGAFSVAGGVAAGHVKTGYYDGLIGAPYFKVRHNFTGVYVKVMPSFIAVEGLDVLTAVTTGVSIVF